MSHAAIDKKLRSFLNRPTEQKYRWLRRSVMNESQYDPRAAEIIRIELQLATDNPKQILDQTGRLAWFWQLCPRWHFVRARAFEKLGWQRRTSASVARMQSCLRGALSTGNGSRQAPFSAVFLTDQSDLMQVIGEKTRYQQLVQVAERRYDVITSHDGQDIWFDVTELLARLPVPLEAVAAGK